MMHRFQQRFTVAGMRRHLVVTTEANSVRLEIEHQLYPRAIEKVLNTK